MMKLPKTELENYMDDMISFFEIKKDTDISRLNIKQIDYVAFNKMFLNDESYYKNKVISYLIEYSNITNILENELEMFREIFTQALKVLMDEM